MTRPVSEVDDDATIVDSSRTAVDEDATIVDSSRAAVDDDATIVNPTRESAGEVPSQSSDSELSPGQIIKDRFIIESIIGRGGMGVVYRAKDLRKEETRDREPYVALKVLSDEYRLDPAMVIGLQREARKAQTLAHPAITTVYDFDREGEMVYITMEMLEGQPLDEFIAAHPNGLPKKEVFLLVRGLCLGLAYAHNKNIIHSDFKPGNVFRTSENRVKILDFGIARAAPMAETGASSETTFDAGELGALTPSYAALEMWTGTDPHPSDDVYALALVTYELLTGRHPFDSLSAPEAKSRGMKPAPIAELNRREWRALQHGLAFERENRTSHAAEFLREVEGAPKLRMFLSATALALVLALGYLGFQEYQKVVERQPEIAFQNLPAETQASFNALMGDAEKLEQWGDMASALDKYTQAYQMHPRNEMAVNGMVRLIQSLFTETLRGGRADELAALDSNIDALMAVDGFLAKHPVLLEVKDAIAATP